MFRNFLVSSVLLGFVAFATAAPITFTNPEYSVDAFAGVGQNGPDFDVKDASSTLPPLNVNASFSTAAGTASAGASAELGKLSAVTNVSSTGVSSDASSDSSFFGVIDDILGGTYRLAFNFITDNPIVGPDPSASAKLAIKIVSGVNTLYNEEFLSTSSLTDFIFSLTPDFTGVFDITLISRANSTSGSASNSAKVDFAINAVNGVPEPHEGMLLLVGGLAMYNLIRRGRRRAGSLLA